MHRQCKKQNDKENVDQLAANSAEEPKLQEVCSKRSIAVFGKTEKSCLSNTSIGMNDKPKSVVIDIPEIVVTAPHSEDTEKSSLSDTSIGMKDEPKSVVINVPEIVVTAPLSEAGSQSESSADESSLDEGEYIDPPVIWNEEHSSLYISFL